MTAATPLARYGAIWRGALRKRPGDRRKLHHHPAPELLSFCLRGGLSRWVLQDISTLLNEKDHP